MTTTPDGVIVTVNQTFLALTRYTRDDLVGLRTFADLLTPGGRICHETYFAPMLQMQERVSAKQRPKPGRPRWRAPCKSR